MNAALPCHHSRLLAGVLSLVAGAAAQQPARLIEELGDPARAQAAAAALLELGDQALPALQELFEAWQTRSPEQQECLRQALRVTALLGERAAPLKSVLIDLVTSQEGGRFAPGRNKVKSLVPDVMAAVASLTPYGDKVEFHNLFHFTVVGTGEEKGRSFAAVYRYRERDEARADTVEAARQRLAEDKIFAREVAAETLGRLGSIEDAELLRDRLLARNTQPVGWDALKHNGFVVPTEDQFFLCAGRALVRLAPQDSVSVIGHAMVARHHPFTAVRKRALLALTRFGPDVSVAIPELMAVATEGEPELAAEALKVLGMAGRDVGQHLVAIDRLATALDPHVARLAIGLAARLRAMGCEAPANPEETAESELITRLRVAVDALNDNGEAGEVLAAEQQLIAAPEAAWPLLLARMQRDVTTAPDALIRCLAAIGKHREVDERMQMRSIVATTGDRWSAPYFSSSSGGRAMTGAARDAYGVLTVGVPEAVQDVAAFLTDENVAVRLAAARQCAGRAEQVAAASAQVHEALWQAVVDDHPAKSPFQQGDRNRAMITLDLSVQIKAAAAVALRASEQPRDRHDDLLRHALCFEDSAAVAAAIKWFGEAADRADLERAAEDKARPDVAEAAKQELDRRDK